MEMNCWIQDSVARRGDLPTRHRERFQAYYLRETQPRDVSNKCGRVVSSHLNEGKRLDSDTGFDNCSFVSLQVLSYATLSQTRLTFCGNEWMRRFQQVRRRYRLCPMPVIRWKAYPTRFKSPD